MGSSMMANIITKVRVENLFGLYTYTLPNEGQFTNAAILYGDNGAGKSTILRLVYHLLSAAHNRGHRTSLFQVRFDLLEVTLSSGLVLRARPKVDEGILALEIERNSELIATWNYIPDRSQRSLFDTEAWSIEIDENYGEKRIVKRRRQQLNKPENSIEGEEIYLEALRENSPKVFILNADRRLDSDTVADPSDEIELRRLMHYDTPKSINQLVKRSREIGLTQALSAASKWISQKAIIGTNQGSTNVHSVYVDVIKHLVSPYLPAKEDSVKISTSELIDKLKKIEIRMEQHASYQLATKLSTEEFISALRLKNPSKVDLAAELLQPYVKSLDRRLEAVEPIYQIIDDFVRTLNGFLSDKELNFQLGRGFKILNKFAADLEASQLSSGEQQLLLLFCYVITARDEPSVFMIDEPEISLNIKWQRQLVDSLLEITKGSDIQFIFASHSMELLAKHQDRVVKLENKSS